MRVRSLTCPSCGGRAKIPHGQQEAVCHHCGQPIRLSQAVMEEQSKAWAFPPATPIRPGMKAQFRDQEFEVWGRQVLRQTDEEGTVYQWEEFVLVAPDGDLIYVEYDEGKWKFSEPYVPQAPAPSHQLDMAREGSFVAIDNRSALVTDAGTYQAVHVEGEFPWLAQVGQMKRFVDMTTPAGFVSVEWTQDAIEYYAGHTVDERQIFAMFGWRHLLAALEGRVKRVRSQRVFGVATLVLSIVAFGFWIASMGGGKIVPGGQGTAVIQATGEEGIRFGPIKLSAVGRVHRLEIKGQMREQSNWIQAVLEDENEVELFETNRDMWDESGTDSDGSWHESDTSASTDFVLSKPGDYYLRMYMEPDPANISPASGQASFTLRERVLYPWYLLMLSLLLLVVGIIWLVRSSMVAGGKVWDQVRNPAQAATAQPAGGG